jgi:hypothetical protein
VKNHDFTPKKIIFLPILGGARAGCPPPWIRPCTRTHCSDSEPRSICSFSLYRDRVYK